MSPGKQRRIARMTEQANALGMTLDQWRATRASTGEQRAQTERLLWQTRSVDARFRVKHDIGYGPRRQVQRRMDAYLHAFSDNMSASFDRFLLTGRSA